VVEFEIVDNVPREKWDKYVLAHPNGNIFHTPEMFDVYKATKNYAPSSVFVIEKKKGNIVSLLSNVRVTICDGVLSRLTGRSIFYGGVLVNEGGVGAEALVLGLKFHDNGVKRRVLFSEVRNRDDSSDHRLVLEKNGYMYNDDLTYIIDLEIGKEKIFQAFGTDKKKNIRKAEKKGIIVREMEHVEQVSVFYNIIKDVYKRKRVPLADISLFENSFKVLSEKGMFKIFLAQLGDRPIAGKAVLFFKDRALAWYGGGFEEFLTLHPNEMLTWYVIGWADRNGFREFDLGGAGKPGESYGVRDYKERFGGELVNYGRYMKVYSPALLKIANIGYQIYRKFSKR
jgi:lipid II:glycine glycyltransferase (peptidoglycan interpeptide bridge formation enzyme)